MSENLDYEINQELGECYLFMGDLEKAQEYYEKAATSNGVHAAPYMGLATIAVQRGSLDEALGLYQRAASVEQSDKALAGIGLVRMEQGSNDEAYEKFAESLAINPENHVALFGIVQTGYTMDRLESVIPYLEKCLAVDPMKSDVRYTLAGCLVSLGQTTDAGRHLEILIEHEPGHTAARELYEQVTAL
ncbi:tetratricopeptide repeat protein [Oceanidesulfovibrio marinus]|uniref:Tetratricopeptide repeat protein n=1 Tax=Oceanidesulfovibrio marinus TaxID=370038 RepID=A0A6P1Z9R1_9BACT|nr:tetratricopeptide repeat protein [Oceanidesulfovibrio marinus]QJT10487.1 tetratricopeptide repeat protein [Oceanidesulfovibrio marinus]TVM30191.1 hypothetical protein DQK91_21570 [Oceanidesulfovibrio marinus]